MNYQERAKYLTTRVRNYDPMLYVDIATEAIEFSFYGQKFVGRIPKLALCRSTQNLEYQLCFLPTHVDGDALLHTLGLADMSRHEKYQFMNDINYYQNKYREQEKEKRITAMGKEFEPLALGRTYFT